MVRIIRRSLRNAPPMTTSTGRISGTRNGEQQALIAREADLLSRRLPCVRDSFACQVEDLAEWALESPSRWKQEKLAVSSLLSGIPTGLAECLLDPDRDSVDLWEEELSVRPEDLALLAGTPGQWFSKRRVIDPGILDAESDYWDEAWRRWLARIEASDGNPESPWNARAYFEDISAAHGHLREQLVSIRQREEWRGVSLVGPFSLVKLLMSDRRSSRSWPQDDGLVVLRVIIDGALDSPTPSLIVNDVRHSGGKTFKPPTCPSLSSWELFLDEDRWNKCFMRWACLE